MNVLIRGIAGLVIWAIGFSVLYGVHGVACEAGWDARALAGLHLHRWSLLATWLLTIAANAWLVWVERRGGSFANELARAGAVVGLVSTIVTGMPTIVFPACV